MSVGVDHFLNQDIQLNFETLFFSFLQGLFLFYLLIKKSLQITFLIVSTEMYKLGK